MEILVVIPLDAIGVFFVASLSLGLAPGPDNIFVLTQSVVHGRLAGVLITLGLCTGLLVHTAAVAFGVSAILAESEIAFTGLKILGAGYLLYLAWRAFSAEASFVAAGQGDYIEPTDQIGLRHLYGRGILMNLTNPKVALFFLAFLPQFADPERGSLALQILILGAVFIVATIVVFGGVALSAGFVGTWLQRSTNARIWLNRLSGIVFVGLALRLATIER